MSDELSGLLLTSLTCAVCGAPVGYHVGGKTSCQTRLAETFVVVEGAAAQRRRLDFEFGGQAASQGAVRGEP